MLVSLIFGSLAFTLWNWLWKKIKEAGTAFNKSYLFSMLIAMLLSVIAVPFVLSNQMVPDNILPFLIVASAAIGFAANALINTPLTYYLNQIESLKTTLKLPSTATIKSAERKIIEAIGIIILIAAILGASAYAAVTYTVNITASGSLTGVGISFYSDQAGQVSITNVNWGNIPPGGSVTVAVYAKSTSNVPIVLSLNTSGWTPASIASSLTLSWDYNGATIQPGAMQKISLILTAASDAPAGTNFSFNIIITAVNT
jgi:hypothetical protein